MNNARAYYPLAAGNFWTFEDGFGGQFTTSVIRETAPEEFLVKTSTKPEELRMKKEGGNYFADVLTPDNMQLTLKDELKIGDTWNITFKANGFDNVLINTVKELLPSKTVGNTSYNDVVMIEAESRMIINGYLTPINFFTRYYFARGVGPILTTATGGSAMPLISCNLAG